MTAIAIRRINHLRSFHTFSTLERQRQVRHTKPIMSSASISKQEFDYFMVLDFEATCDNEKPIVPQEIIEFPVLKVNGQTFEVESTFHEYVEPAVNKELTPFCTQLTGIIQEMVDGKPHLKETLDKLDSWMTQEVFYKPDVKCIFVTCGDWDLKTMLPKQCEYLHHMYQPYLKNWINIKHVFEELKGIKPRKKGDLIHMLEVLEIPHTGHYHSGIDDCKNIANILQAIAKTGYVFKETGRKF